MASDVTLAQDNIIAGSGKLYLAALAAAADTWVIVGHTTGGISMQVTRDMFDIESDQTKAVIRKELQLSKVMLKTSLLELDVANLQKVWHEPTGNLDVGNNILTISIASVVEQQLLGLGPGIVVTSLIRVRSVVFPRVVSFDIGEISLWSRTDPASMDVSFECLYDDTTSRFGYIQDYATVTWNPNTTIPSSVSL